MDKEPARMEKPSFDDLKKAAREGEWAFVDKHVPNYLDEESVRWALTHGLVDEKENIRDLAATILNESGEELDVAMMQKIERIMITDSNRFVRLRLAIALHKRGYYSPAVSRLWNEALKDPEVGEAAKKFDK